MIDMHTLKYSCNWLLGRLYCSMHGVAFSEGLRPYGCPIILRHKGAVISLGSHVVLNSNPWVNPAGISRKVTLAAMSYGSEIVIGDHTGLSGVAVVAAKSVRIGNHVNIGVNTVIYDTDFHSLDWKVRRTDNGSQAAVAPVVIGDDVWIGANCIILKGVHIGARAVVAAGSVVTSDIPEDSVSAGNPARHIKRVHEGVSRGAV